MEDLGYDPSLLAFQWFVCFFALNINEQVINNMLYYLCIDILENMGPLHAKRYANPIRHSTCHPL